MADATPPLVKISDLARLADVPVGTIKYYLRAGLLPGPSKRTSRNMAYYDSRLAERVRVIKQLQRRHGLPLRAIAEMLEPAPSAVLRRDLDEHQRRHLMGRRRRNRHRIADGAADGAAGESAGVGLEFTAEEIIHALCIDGDDLAALEEQGLLAAQRSSSGSSVYSGADLELLEALHDARGLGLGPLFSLEALAIYAEVVGDLVEQELALHREFLERQAAGVPGDEPGDGTRARSFEQLARVGERIMRAMRSKQLARALLQATRSDRV